MEDEWGTWSLYSLVNRKILCNGKAHFFIPYSKVGKVRLNEVPLACTETKDSGISPQGLGPWRGSLRRMLQAGNGIDHEAFMFSKAVNNLEKHCLLRAAAGAA